MKFRSKKIVALLVMLSFVLSSGTFAYWANYVEGTSAESTGTLEVGSADKTETRFDLSNSLNSGGLLVPVGQAVNSNEGAVEKIDLSFDLEWVEDEDTTQVLGTGSVGEIDIEHTVVITVDGVELDAETNQKCSGRSFQKVVGTHPADTVREHSQITSS